MPRPQWIRPVLTIVALSLAAMAAAETGTFRMVLGGQHDYTIFGFVGQIIAGGAIEGVNTITESSGDPFMVGEQGRSTCMVYSKQNAANLESFDFESPCVHMSSGDTLFTLTKGVGTMADISLRIVSGTGKFAGITGSCSYEFGYLEDDWLVFTAECEWERE